MGDPRKQRKKYSGPSHPWMAERLDAERVLLKEYGLKNKKELWKMGSLLAKFKNKTKELIGSDTEQSKKEEKELLERLKKLELLEGNAKLEDVLGLDVRNILERRLQTQIYRIGLAKSAKQARQFITHNHIIINGKRVNVPSYLILKEDKISFSDKSSLKDSEHPERVITKKKKEAKLVGEVSEEEKKLLKGVVEEEEIKEELKEEKEKPKKEVKKEKKVAKVKEPKKSIKKEVKKKKETIEKVKLTPEYIPELVKLYPNRILTAEGFKRRSSK